MGLLYAKDNKIYANKYLEIYIPQSYIKDEIAFNRGTFYETFGVCNIRGFENGKPEKLMILNLPITCNFMLYESEPTTVTIHDNTIEVLALKYPKDSHIMHQSLTKNVNTATSFLDKMLSGKLPNTLNYLNIINIWWKNLEFSGISYNVPSKIYELIVANIYRDPNNPKRRYGQYLGEGKGNCYDYKTDNVREVVKNLSTFSGMTFEAIGSMISSGVNNSLDGIEEPISPLEKIIHY